MIVFFIGLMVLMIVFLLLFREQNKQNEKDKASIRSLEGQLMSADKRIKNIIMENKNSPDLLYDGNGTEYKKYCLTSGAIIYVKKGEKLEFNNGPIHYNIKF